MPEQSVIHSTFVIERSYPKPPEKVFAAFADASKKRRWAAAENDSTEVEKFEMDFRPGGAEHYQYRFKEGSPFPGVALISEGTYQDIVPNRRIVTASSMALGDRRFSAALVTIELLATEQGTDLICTHQGAFFEGSDGPKMREEGWRGMFDHLATELAG